MAAAAKYTAPDLYTAPPSFETHTGPSVVISVASSSADIPASPAVDIPVAASSAEIPAYPSLSVDVPDTDTMDMLAALRVVTGRSWGAPSTWEEDPAGAASTGEVTGRSTPPYHSFLWVLCCAFMLYSNFVNVGQPHGFGAVILSVVSSVCIIGFLYLALREFGGAVAGGDHTTRGRLKVSMWFLLAIAWQLQFS